MASQRSPESYGPLVERLEDAAEACGNSAAAMRNYGGAATASAVSRWTVPGSN